MSVAEAARTTIDQIEEHLGAEAESLLSHTCTGIPKESLSLPGPEHLDRVFGVSDRRPGVLVNLARIYGNGRLAGSGYVSILPVDQGIEHSAAASSLSCPACSFSIETGPRSTPENLILDAPAPEEIITAAG